MANLYPKTKPYKTGFLKVGDGHSLYYELCGNPKGKAVLFLHGGPGGGLQKKDRQYFNPKKFNVILFDQRGCGRSKPFASVKANTTGHLVADIRRLLAHLGIEKVFLFGGSWGSTLALAYAIKYPQSVAGMLLRGIFLASKSDINYYIDGAVKEMFPEARERFLSIVPKKNRKNPEAYYFKKILNGSKAEREKFAFERTYYESKISALKQDEKRLMKKLKRWKYLPFALIASKYAANNCYLENNYILKNAGKLSKIPTTIIHGRYDLVCSPSSAYKLHKKIEGSKLIYTTAGHLSSEKETQEALVKEMNRMGKQTKWRRTNGFLRRVCKRT